MKRYTFEAYSTGSKTIKLAHTDTQMFATIAGAEHVADINEEQAAELRRLSASDQITAASIFCDAYGHGGAYLFA